MVNVGGRKKEEVSWEGDVMKREQRHDWRVLGEIACVHFVSDLVMNRLDEQRG
jgi:hypothetical protein